MLLCCYKTAKSLSAHLLYSSESCGHRYERWAQLKVDKTPPGQIPAGFEICVLEVSATCVALNALWQQTQIAVTCTGNDVCGG